MRSYHLAAAMAAATLIAGGAEAVRLDIGEGGFTFFDPNPILADRAVAFAQTAGGVTFTFFDFNGVAGAQFSPDSNGDVSLRLGGGGGSPTLFSFTVDQDVTLTEYGLAGRFDYLNSPIFDILDDGTALSADNFLGPNPGAQMDFAFNDGNLSLSAGTVYTFDVKDTGAAVQGFLESFVFEASAASVPGPAALGLLGFGCVLLAAGKTRR